MGRAFGKEKFDTVIGDQSGTQRHQLQGECRFSGSAGAGDQQGATVNCNCAGLPCNAVAPLPRQTHTGRPTTNRAPRGSDVTSASVGRMFSAQMTPPWASTICLEIARPRPELLPNWPSGRSE